MNTYPVTNEDNESSPRWNSDSLSAHSVKGILSAEVLRAIKMRDSSMSRFQTVSTVTTSTSSMSPVPKGSSGIHDEELARLSKWNPSKWMSPLDEMSLHSLLPNFRGSSEPTSRKHESSITELIATARNDPSLSFANRLATRLQDLAESSEDEFPDQEPMSSRSLRDFLSFCRLVLGVNCPSVVLTFEGNIRAEWTIDRNKHFAVEFLGGNDVRFVVFAPDPKVPSKTSRVSGVSTVESVIAQVHPYGVFDWIKSQFNIAA